MPKLKSAADLETLRKEILDRQQSDKPCVTICSGTGCHAYGSEKVAQTFAEEIKNNDLEDKVSIRRTGCHGYCERGTIVVIFPQEICYLRVKPEDVSEIISTTLINGKVVDRLLYEGEGAEKIIHEGDIPFYKYPVSYTHLRAHET